MKHLLLSGVAATCLLASGCAGQDTPNDDTGDGKADGLGEGCGNTALDQAGVCRAADGTFAEASCCSQDVLATDLSFDLSTRTATATVSVKGSKNQSVVLEAGDLAVESVTADGKALDFSVEEGTLVVSAGGAPTSEWSAKGNAAEITVDYAFATHENFDGFMDQPLTDMSFTWPEFCGNLFPCESSPADGITYTMEVTGVPEGLTAVYPTEVAADAPSYMPAFSVGAYTYEELGVTKAGTTVGVYYLEGGEETALAATDDLVAAFDFFETTYGPYSFGDEVASVSVDWGEGDFGGMEHHPYWHITRGSFGNKQVHHHEAAHGWFGNGVRIKCLEDFVLSEGVVSYLEARSTEATGGDPVAIWSRFRDSLEGSIESRDFVVWPKGCNELGSLFEIFTGLPYMKGAFFFRQVEQQIGRDTLDAALSSFYRANVGEAARFGELVDHIEKESGADIEELADVWLRQTGIPCELGDDGFCADSGSR